MGGLGKALADRFDTHLTSTHELWIRGQTSYTSGLVSLIREIGSKPIVLVGWSMGGMIVLETGFHHPELVSQLVLVNATAKFCSGNGYVSGVPVQHVRAMALGLERDISTTMSRFYDQSDSPVSEHDSSMNDRLNKVRSLDIDELRDGLVYLQNTDLRDCLTKIPNPVLIFHGMEDKIIPWQAAQMLSRGLPVSNLSFINEIGHTLPIRKPLRIASEMMEFLET